jgi:hypothetical protein
MQDKSDFKINFDLLNDSNNFILAENTISDTVNNDKIESDCSTCQEKSTPTATRTPRPTTPPTKTPTKTATPTRTRTHTPTPTRTTVIPPNNETLTPTPTNTLTPTPTRTTNATLTPTPTITISPTRTINGTVTPTPTESLTPTQTRTSNNTQTPTPTESLTPTPTETLTPTPTETLTPTPTETLTPTPTLTEGLTPTPTPTETLTPTPTETLTPTPTETLTPTPTETLTPTPTETLTPTPTETLTPTPTETLTPTPTETLTPTPTETLTPTPTETLTTKICVTGSITSECFAQGERSFVIRVLNSCNCPDSLEYSVDGITWNPAAFSIGSDPIDFSDPNFSDCIITTVVVVPPLTTQVCFRLYYNSLLEYSICIPVLGSCDPPDPPDPPVLCSTEPIRYVRLMFSAFDGPRPGNHGCNRALFEVKINDIIVGTGNLNNAGGSCDPGQPNYADFPNMITHSSLDRANIFTIDSPGISIKQLDVTTSGYEIELIGLQNLSNYDTYTGCSVNSIHQGIGWVELLDQNQNLLFSAGIPNDQVVFIVDSSDSIECGTPTPTPTESLTPTPTQTLTPTPTVTQDDTIIVSSINITSECFTTGERQFDIIFSHNPTCSDSFEYQTNGAFTEWTDVFSAVKTNCNGVSKIISIPSDATSVCFRFYATKYNYSNTICVLITPCDPPEPPEPPVICSTADIRKVRVMYSDTDGPNPGGHYCGRGNFELYINDNSVGLVNLNNDNGSCDDGVPNFTDFPSMTTHGPNDRATQFTIAENVLKPISLDMSSQHIGQSGYVVSLECRPNCGDECGRWVWIGPGSQPCVKWTNGTIVDGSPVDCEWLSQVCLDPSFYNEEECSLVVDGSYCWISYNCCAASHAVAPYNTGYVPIGCHIGIAWLEFLNANNDIIFSAGIPNDQNVYLIVNPNDTNCVEPLSISSIPFEAEQNSIKNSNIDIPSIKNNFKINSNTNFITIEKIIPDAQNNDKIQSDCSLCQEKSTPTATRTPRPTTSPTKTPTKTATPTRTRTHTPTPTRTTVIPPNNETLTPTPTNTLTPTRTTNATLTPTPTITISPTRTINGTVTPTPTETLTPTPTRTSNNIQTPTPTETLTPTPTRTSNNTQTPTPTETLTPTPTKTSNNTPTPTETLTPTPTRTSNNTQTPTPTETLTPTPTETLTPTPTETLTPTPTETLTSTPTETLTPTPTQTLISDDDITSANYNSDADWDGVDGNVTTVSTNGRSSHYGTYDQTGNVWEWNSYNSLNDPTDPNIDLSMAKLAGGGWMTGQGNEQDTLLGLQAGTVWNISANTIQDDFGFRICASTGSPENSTLVTVGDIGNSADINGLGSVNYEYKIGKYTITNCDYIRFLNAIARFKDPYNLYHIAMGEDRCGIIKNIVNETTQQCEYKLKRVYQDKPVVIVNWFMAARYCNWLHNNAIGLPVYDNDGNLDLADVTENGAYALSGTQILVKEKNSDAQFWIPTQNEWYKAAYYKGGGTNAGYWKYATRTNLLPNTVSADSYGNGPIGSTIDFGTSCSMFWVPEIQNMAIAPTTNKVYSNITNSFSIVNNTIPDPQNNSKIKSDCSICQEKSTPTATASPTKTATPSTTANVIPMATSAQTSTPTHIFTQTPTATSYITPTPTETLTPTPTSIESETPTPTPTPTEYETPTPTPTESLTPTPTSVDTLTPTPTKSLIATPTPTKNNTPSSQPLFDKSSWLSVPQPYRSYLNQAADRWSKYIKYNSIIYETIKNAYSKLNKVWNGLALDLTKFNLINEPMSLTIASCGPSDIGDLDDEDGNLCNSITFQLVINEYFNNQYSEKDWVEILTHEFGHALGIGAFWNPQAIPETDGTPPIDNLLDGTVYSNAKNAYNSITSLTRTKIPLSSDDGHWPEEYRSQSGNEQSYYGFSNELMVPSFTSGKISILSLLSIKTLVDFGYEEVSPGSSEGIPDLITSISPFSVVNNIKIIKRNCRCEHKPIVTKLIKQKINSIIKNRDIKNNTNMLSSIKENLKIKSDCSKCVEEQTPSPTKTQKATATPTKTSILTRTPTNTATFTRTPTPTCTFIIPQNNETLTPTPTESLTPTVTKASNNNQTPTPTTTPTKASNNNQTPTPTETLTPTPTETLTPTSGDTPTPTEVLTRTPTPTVSPTKSKNQTFIPDAPTIISGTAGNAEVTLLWSAPASNGGTPIIDYIIQYSSDSGLSWTTFNDGISISTSATITGLTNGTDYVFRVAAINNLGMGAYSGNSSIFTPMLSNTPTPTESLTPTPTETLTPTPTETLTTTPTESLTPTPTLTEGLTQTPTPTETLTPTPTLTEGLTQTPTPTETLTPTPTESLTPTPTETLTPTPTETLTPTPTETLTPTPTETLTPTPTETLTPTPTETLTPTPTPTETLTPTPTETLTPTPTPTETLTPTPTETLTPTPTETLTTTPTESLTPTPTETLTPTPTESLTPTLTLTLTPTATANCPIVDASTMWEYQASCLCEDPYTSQQCYSPFGSPMAKTYLVNIPSNPYFFPDQPPAPPLASGLLCNNPRTQFRISNKIKITIPNDPIFSGIYVWDREPAIGGSQTADWILNLNESQLSNSINCVPDLGLPSNLIGFAEASNPSRSNPASFEETYTIYALEPEKVYAFPAKYYMYLTAAAASTESMGHRLSVGFTLPIRYRHAYGDWIVVDRLIANGKKTPHKLNGSPNYAILNEGPDPGDNTISYKFIDSISNQPICSSGLNELGFSFKTSGPGLGFECSDFGLPYPYFGEQELSWFEPKIGVQSLVEFVYDCRPTINCNIAAGATLDTITGATLIDPNSCLGLTINVDHNCVNPAAQMRLYILNFADNLSINFKNANNLANTYRKQTYANTALELPISVGSNTASLVDIKYYINNYLAVYEYYSNAYRYKCIDLYVVNDPFVNYIPEEGPPPCVVIIPSDDC